MQQQQQQQQQQQPGVAAAAAAVASLLQNQGHTVKAAEAAPGAKRIPKKRKLISDVPGKVRWVGTASTLMRGHGAFFGRVKRHCLLSQEVHLHILTAPNLPQSAVGAPCIMSQHNTVLHLCNATFCHSIHSMHQSFNCY